MLPGQEAAGQQDGSIAAQALAVNAAGNPIDGGSAAPAAAPVVETPVVPASFANEDAEMAAREAEMERLEAGAAAGQGASQTVQPAAQPAATTTTEAGRTATAASKSSAEQAIIALRRKNAELAQANTRLLGEVSAYKDVATRSGAAPSGEAQGQQQQEAEPTFDEIHADIDARREALAAEYDNGQISATELSRQQNALDSERRRVQAAEAQAIAEQAALAAANAPQNDLTLTRETESLVVDYPVLSRLTSTEQWDDIRNLALAEAKAEGQPLTGTDPTTTLALRHRMAALAERIHDKPAYQARLQRQQQSASQQQMAPGAKPGTAAPTAAQRGAKLDLAAQMPPEIGTRGAPATGGLNFEEMERQYGSMNEDQRLKYQDANPAFVAHMTGLAVGR